MKSKLKKHLKKSRKRPQYLVGNEVPQFGGNMASQTPVQYMNASKCLAQSVKFSNFEVTETEFGLLRWDKDVMWKVETTAGFGLHD